MAAFVVVMALVGVSLTLAFLVRSAASTVAPSDQDQIQSTYHAAVNAFSNGDGATFCAQLTPQMQTSIANGEGAPSCEEGLGDFVSGLPVASRMNVRQGTLTDVTVNGDSAQGTSHVNGAMRTVTFSKVNGKWLISGGGL